MEKVKELLSYEEYVRYNQRCRKRKERHGDWRQIYVDCDGMCQFPISDGIVCGELDTLEFHEIFGEAKKNQFKLQQRVLLCNYHHWSVHGEKWVNERRYPSMLQFDVQAEIVALGGRKDWLKHFNLIERRLTYDIENDYRLNKNDLDDSENS